MVVERYDLGEMPSGFRRQPIDLFSAVTRVRLNHQQRPRAAADLQDALHAARDLAVQRHSSGFGKVARQEYDHARRPRQGIDQRIAALARRLLKFVAVRRRQVVKVGRGKLNEIITLHVEQVGEQEIMAIEWHGLRQAGVGGGLQRPMGDALPAADAVKNIPLQSAAYAANAHARQVDAPAFSRRGRDPVVVAREVQADAIAIAGPDRAGKCPVQKLIDEQEVLPEKQFVRGAHTDALSQAGCGL